jgi:hypothetical protein
MDTTAPWTIKTFPVRLREEITLAARVNRLSR